MKEVIAKRKTRPGDKGLMRFNDELLVEGVWFVSFYEAM